MSHVTLVRAGTGSGPRRVPTALYRYFDADMNLLYIGITKSPSGRHAGHRRKSPWMRFAVGSRRIEWIEDRPTAEAAEMEAILTERPLFNIEGNRTVEASARLAMYLASKGEWTTVRHGHDVPRDLSTIDMYDFADRVEEELRALSGHRPRMDHSGAEYYQGKLALDANFLTDERPRYWCSGFDVYAGTGRLFIDRPPTPGNPGFPPKLRFVSSGRSPWELAYNLVQDLDANEFALIDTGTRHTPYDVPKAPWPRRATSSATQ